MRRLKSSFLEYTDEALMKALTQGEKSAFDELYARYASKLFGYFMKMLWNNRIRSEDLLQDLFAKIISQPHLFDPSRNFKTWVYTVAANMCKNEYKRNEVRSNTSNGIDQHYTLSSSEDVGKTVEEKMFKEALGHELENLDPKHREVFILRHMDGLSIKEIAEITGINEGTVKSRLFYAIKKLANELKMFELS